VLIGAEEHRGGGLVRLRREQRAAGLLIALGGGEQAARVMSEQARAVQRVRLPVRNLETGSERERRVYELLPDSLRMAGRSKPRNASGVTKAVISWICAPCRVSTSMARGMKVCVLSFQA